MNALDLRWASLNHYNNIFFFSIPGFTRCSGAKPPLFSSQALIELRLNCRNCRLVLWKVTCSSSLSPLLGTSMDRQALHSLCACVRACMCVKTQSLKSGCVCVSWSRALQESTKGATVVYDVCDANTLAGEVDTLGSAHRELALTLVTL